MEQTGQSGNMQAFAAITEEAVSSGKWRTACRSVRGSSHERSGKPNQDFMGRWPESGDGERVVIVVADGHGSARSFRSDLGSKLAVQVALKVLTPVVQEGSFLDIQRVLTEHQLAEKLVLEWRKCVDDHLGIDPLNDEERALLGVGRGEPLDSEKDYRRYVAYGSTLLAVAATPDYLLIMQLGDGDILFVSKTGEVMRPLPEDSRLFANATTSLSMEDAAKDFRIECYPRQKFDTPFSGLILLSTDGYSNSFQDEANFLKVGTDLLSLLAQHGLSTVDSNLETWLTEASSAGSGDDVTVGLLIQTPVFDPSLKETPANDAASQAEQIILPPLIPMQESPKGRMVPVGLDQEPAPPLSLSPQENADPLRDQRSSVETGDPSSGEFAASNVASQGPRSPQSQRRAGNPSPSLSLTQRVQIPVWLAILAPILSGVAIAALWLLLSHTGMHGGGKPKKTGPVSAVVAKSHPKPGAPTPGAHSQPPASTAQNPAAQSYDPSGA